MAEAPRKWLITGVSSGLGRAIAEKALARGDIVAGTLRKPEQFEDFAALARGRAIPIALDVTDDAGVGPAVATAIAAAGGLDILVNNAGYALMGPIEDIGLPEARREIETNFFGVLKLSQAVLPHFRAQNAGRIINIGSVASVVGFPMNGIYSASKFAVAGFSEALAKECAAFGVKVTCVEPGGFRTQFGVGSLALPSKVSPKNTPAVEVTKVRMAAFAQTAVNDPAKGAAVILALTELDEPPVHFALGADGYAMITGALQARLAEYERFRAFGGETTCGS
ncbi:MAG: SDR family NAD(P)-dependent oxidoreductase [Rhizomicrobium sp.]